MKYKDDAQIDCVSRVDKRYAILSNIIFEGNEAVLDIGCGRGKLSTVLADCVPNGKVTAVDICQNKIQSAIKTSNKLNLNYICKDILACDYAEEFDLVISFACLQHIPNQLKVLQVIQRALKNNGKAFLTLHLANPILQQAILETTQQNNWKLFFRNPCQTDAILNVDSYQSLFQQVGLSTTRFKIVTTFPYATTDEFILSAKDWLVELNALPETLHVEFLKELSMNIAKQPGCTNLEVFPLPIAKLEVEATKTDRTYDKRAMRSLSSAEAGD